MRPKRGVSWVLRLVALVLARCSGFLAKGSLIYAYAIGGFPTCIGMGCMSSRPEGKTCAPGDAAVSPAQSLRRDESHARLGSAFCISFNWNMSSATASGMTQHAQAKVIANSLGGFRCEVGP